MNKKQIKYVDSCRTYTILLQDSGVLPKPKPEWSTFIPKELDIAYVDETKIEYVYHNFQWVELTEQLKKELFGG